MFDFEVNKSLVKIMVNFLCNRRPTALQDRTRDSDDDYQDRDDDVAALANNLSQAFHYGIYSNDMEEVCNMCYWTDIVFYLPISCFM